MATDGWRKSFEQALECDSWRLVRKDLSVSDENLVAESDHIISSRRPLFRSTDLNLHDSANPKSHHHQVF